MIIVRKTEVATKLEAREIARDGDFSLIHTSEFGYEIVYQNGNPVAEKDSAAHYLQLWRSAALRLFAKLDQESSE